MLSAADQIVRPKAMCKTKQREVQLSEKRILEAKSIFPKKTALLW